MWAVLRESSVSSLYRRKPKSISLEETAICLTTVLTKRKHCCFSCMLPGLLHTVLYSSSSWCQSRQQCSCIQSDYLCLGQCRCSHCSKKKIHRLGWAWMCAKSSNVVRTAPLIVFRTQIRRPVGTIIKPANFSCCKSFAWERCKKCRQWVFPISADGGQ